MQICDYLKCILRVETVFFSIETFRVLFLGSFSQTQNEEDSIFSTKILRLSEMHIFIGEKTILFCLKRLQILSLRI